MKILEFTPMSWASVLALLLPAAFGCGSDDAPVDYAERGEWAAGYQATTMSTPDGERRVGLWYPSSSEAVEEITYAFDLKNSEWASEPVEVYGQAIQDAPVAAGRFPVVIFSHGFAANAYWYSYLLEHLSSHGIIVVAPEHEEVDWLQNASSVVQRPRDVSHTIDYVETLAAPGGLFESVADLEQIAVVGHSFGGYTALAAAGARINMDALNERCAALAEDDPRGFLCFPLAGREDTLAELAGIDTPEGHFPSFADDRIKAIVPIAGDAYMFDAAGLAEVSAPMLAIGGTADTGTPMEWGAQLTYDEVASVDRSLASFEGAEHMFVINDCTQMPWTPTFPFYEPMCFDPEWSKEAGHEPIRRLTTAFLRHTLTGDAEARAALGRGADGLANLGFATTLNMR